MALGERVLFALLGEGEGGMDKPYFCKTKQGFLWKHEKEKQGFLTT